MSRLAWTATLVLAATLAGAGAARADVYEPVAIASVNEIEQAARAEHPAISGDGRFLAFDGSFGGVAGVWRKELRTGQVAPVAVGMAGTSAGESKLPSISEDGRYVSFTTTAPLDEKNDTNAGSDVYVRDMEKPGAPCPAGRNELTEPCPFSLASALDGSATGLSYTYESASEKTSDGSLASGRSALAMTHEACASSALSTALCPRVAFVTTAPSNLAGERTPPLQVAVRDIDTQRTRLVSALYDPATRKPAVENGHELPVPLTPDGKTGAVFDLSSIPRFQEPDPALGASISADGSTVAWLGQQIALQVPALAEDVARKELLYAEPLWRRIVGSQWPATRRVTGGSDPETPACEAAQAGGEVELTLPPTLEDPCQGPFNVSQNIKSVRTPRETDYLPRLSANGNVVAFLASTPLVEGGEFGSTGEFSDDLFVVNMEDPRQTRVEALRRLTAIAAGAGRDFGRVEPIEDLSVSPKGDQIAFASRRTVFPLGSPSYVSSPLAAPAEESGPQEIYNVDFGNDTLTRVTHGFSGTPTQLVHVAERGFAGSPSFSSDGDRLAFSSVAPNLVYGDGNEASDVFVVDRKVFTPTPVQQYISQPPGSPAGEPAWLFGVSARSRRDGSVLLEVFVPGAGQLRASALSRVLVVSTHTAHGASGKRSRSHTRGGTVIATRTVATAARTSAAEGLVLVPLVLASHYRPLALKRGGQSATVTLLFSSPGHRLARDTIAVTFVGPALPHRRQASKRKHSSSGGQHP